MTSSYLLQNSPAFASRDSPRSSLSSPVSEHLTSSNNNLINSNFRRQQQLQQQPALSTDTSSAARAHLSGHHRSSSSSSSSSMVPSQLRCGPLNPHFSLSSASSSFPVPPSVIQPGDHRPHHGGGIDHQRSTTTANTNVNPGRYMQHLLQHRGIFGLGGSPWVASPHTEFNKSLTSFQSPIENLDLWHGGTNLSLLSHGAGGVWPGYDSRGHDVSFAYPYAPLNYDVRRKNATRESTTTLKAWLFKHIKNPYPTKGEKVMLAIVTKMSLTQVSTWFANARRRLKKENKMQWSPRQRTEDDDDDKNSLSDVDNDEVARRCDVTAAADDDNEEIEVDADDSTTPHPDEELNRHEETTKATHRPPLKPDSTAPVSESPPPSSSSSLSSSSLSSLSPPSENSKSEPPAKKPKIWSLADLVNSDDHKPKSDRPPTLHQPLSTNERQSTSSWMTSQWMFQAAIYRQMLNMQLQHHQKHLQHQQHQQQQQQKESDRRGTQRQNRLDGNQPLAAAAMIYESVEERRAETKEEPTTRQSGPVPHQLADSQMRQLTSELLQTTDCLATHENANAKRNIMKNLDY